MNKQQYIGDGAYASPWRCDDGMGICITAYDENVEDEDAGLVDGLLPDNELHLSPATIRNLIYHLKRMGAINE